jgi:hypothetical protein
MTGGCLAGPHGFTCWNEGWLGPVVFAVLLGVAIVAIARALHADPKAMDVWTYYRTRRGLLLTLLFVVAYGAGLALNQWLVSVYHLNLWAAALLAIVPLALVALLDWALRRSTHQRS